MDVDKLKAELEKHIANNPHEDAPGGFRDRFETVAEEYAANDGDFPKAALEAQLQRIRDEAEAAAAAGSADASTAEERAVERESAGVAPPEAAVPRQAVAPRQAPPRQAPAPPEAGFVQRYGIALVVGVVVLVVGFFYFR